MKENFNKLFTRFLKELTPVESWTKLILLTRSNGKPIAENATVKSGSWYKLGISITKINMGYRFISRTIENCEEKINSDAIISDSHQFISGIVNVFALGFTKDIGGDYHKVLLSELLEAKTLIWDKKE
ncbi:MAG: hypothetical protein Hyperionvirus4_49 [Hyperionvirus sp.]|uniref:Uncharacterized protein n=1 Tax=Hyperionvirus sp. TaxID=2487770 RepID=A0A3G5A9C3_9VIRU|nr:MAG: hypothetical protein Hyperionvirus4_49 [Hyperionvirus sp.]